MTLRRVVATVTLVGLGPGQPVWADDQDPQVARWLRGGQLRALDDEPRPEHELLADAIVEVNAQLGERGELRSEVSLAPPEQPKPRRAPAKKIEKK